MEAQDVLDTLEILEEVGVSATVEGGWGIDALLGYQYRDHSDLDLIVETKWIDVALDAMAAVGFVVIVDHRPVSVRLADPHGRAIDITFVVFDGTNAAWRGSKDPARIEPDYPSHGFTYGWIAGRKVACLSPETQVRRHLGYRYTDRDVSDLKELKERFSVALPEGLY